MTACGPLALLAVCFAGALAACQTKAPDPPPSPPAAATVANQATHPVLTPIDWTAAPDCRAKLDLLVEATRTGHWPPEERPPIAVVLPGLADRLDWLASPSVTVSADLPLEVRDRTDPAIRETPCLVVVQPARDQRVGQRLIGQETVRSLYESGTRSERNPEYDAAQLRVRQAERAANEKGPGVLQIGDPLIDIFGLLVGGVISGFRQGRREREVDEAMTALAATPRSLEQPVYRAYQFERQTILAGKEATVSVALVDRANRRLWQAQLRQRERRQFEILEGLDPRDRDYQKYTADSVTRQDFERWQNEPPQLELSAVVAALREASPVSGPDSMTAAIEALEAPAPTSASATTAPVGALADLDLAERPTPNHHAARPTNRSHPSAGLDPGLAPPDGFDGLVGPATAAAEPLAGVAVPEPLAGVAAPELAPAAGAAAAPGGDPRTASVVRVHAGTRAGSAVYVRSDLVLTTATLVAGSAVVEVATADGTRVLGLVARTDPAHQLALVQVARPGPPAALYDGLPVPSGGSIESIALTEGAGVLVTPGRYRGGAALADPAASSAASHAQVEVRAPPVEPDGLPWFLGDRVIAIGAGSAVGSDRSALAAIPASEIRAFLYGTDGALAKLP